MKTKWNNAEFKIRNLRQKIKTDVNKCIKSAEIEYNKRHVIQS